MKQISVNRNCSGCGLCIVNCHYLQENAEGNAEPVAGKAIQDRDIENIKKVIAECPENALQIVETGSTNKKGAAGVAEIITALKNKCNSFTVKKISNSDVKLNIKDYYFPIPSSSKEYRRDYTSESSAKSAARDEFNRLCYSETAYRPMIKKVFVEYKVNVLKPYYTCTDTEDSAYYTYNQQIRKLLSDAYAEIGEVLSGNRKIPETWKSFSVYLKEKDWAIEPLKEFDERSTSSGIISAMKDISHTGLNDYVNGMDFDYDETYVGEGLFGKSKYKDMWYYSGFHGAAKEFVDDLTWAIGHMSSDIEDGAVDSLNNALSEFEKKAKEALKAKISELEQYVKYDSTYQQIADKHNQTKIIKEKIVEKVSAEKVLFRMNIADVFAITGRGTVVTGHIDEGMISVGDSITLKRKDGSSRDVVITGIETFRKLLDKAQKGDDVGLLLRGVQKSEVGAGDTLEKVVNKK